MELADAKRLKELEKENSELKKMLENRLLKEVNSQNGKPCAVKVSRCAYSAAAAVLGAKGVHLP